jgi:hypothetical protein
MILQAPLFSLQVADLLYEHGHSVLLIDKVVGEGLVSFSEFLYL